MERRRSEEFRECETLAHEPFAGLGYAMDHVSGLAEAGYKKGCAV
jgi:hypothetical protein